MNTTLFVILALTKASVQIISLSGNNIGEFHFKEPVTLDDISNMKAKATDFFLSPRQSSMSKRQECLSMRQEGL